MRRSRSRNPDRAPKIIEHVGGIIVVIGALVATFSVAYWLTFLIYQRLGLHPSPWLAQIITAFLGLAMLATIISLIFRFIGRPQQEALFIPVLAALQQIAQGDFRARVETQLRGDGFFNDLVTSVNTVAVELDQLEQLRQEFISNVSHEIQSPLTSIRGFAQALQRDDLDPAARRHYLSIIEAESLRLSKLSESLLSLSALEAGQVKFAPQPYRLDKQLRGLILACEPQWAAKRLDLDVALDEITLTADEDLLSQVWLNLITNSIKFTPAQGRVQVTCCLSNGQVKVIVSDTGPGLAAADLPHLFERFYKADRSRTAAAPDGLPTASGSGLGLAIAHKIVTLHHGTITAASHPPAGAEFTVTLPIAQP